MSGQGSSSSGAAVRVEAYLDQRPEAVKVLTAPPFRFQLDTAELEEGEHILRLVRIDASGNRRERRIPFTVEHKPGFEVHGLEPGGTATGRVEVEVATPAASPPPPPTQAMGPSIWLYLLASVLVLGGIWVFFMVVPIYSSVVSAPSQGAAGGAASAQTAGPPVDQTLFKAGEKLYTADCAGCHKPSGEGLPPTFPALAGNSFLSDPAQVVKRIYDGAGAMPSHHSYSAKMLAEVATYIRNSWGNGYGGVSVDVVAKAVPQSAPSGTPSSGSSSPSSTAPSSTAPSSTTSTAAVQAGEKLYTSDCAGCHQPNGAGLPPSIPALAGNGFLSDATAVLQLIVKGKGIMPARPSFTTKQLADVATYVRTSWGNSYGAVSVEQAKQAALKAAP